MQSTRTVAGIAVASAMLAVLLCGVVPWGSAPWWALPILAGALLAAEHHIVWITVGRQAFAFALGDALLASALVVSPGWWIVVAMVVGGGVGYYLRKSGPLKLGFNIAQAALGTSCAVAVSWALGGGVTGAVVGLTAFVIVNYFEVTAAITLTSARRLADVLRDTALLHVIQSAGNVSIGLLAGWLLVHEPLGLLGLVAPLVLLWMSYQQQSERTAEARLFAELADARQRVSETSIDTSAHLLIRSAARVFGGAEVELVLRHPEGLFHYVGDEDGVADSERVSADALATPWALRALGAGGVASGIEDERPYCSAILGSRGNPVGLLVARRARRARPFARQDERLVEVLVGQAEAWLSAASLAAHRDDAVDKARAYGDATRALGDLGAYTTPSLVVLRESANRLQRLANSFSGNDPVRDIVDELHSVERAVASLLGAVALASEGAPTSEFAALEGEMAEHEAARKSRNAQSAEWTTTGRLDASDAV